MRKEGENMRNWVWFSTGNAAEKTVFRGNLEKQRNRGQDGTEIKK